MTNQSASVPNDPELQVQPAPPKPISVAWILVGGTALLFGLVMGLVMSTLGR
jgi:hypothetical protein